MQRQGMVEGGFNGRTNKLVDGCYSFWQGALFAIMQRLPPSALRITSQASLQYSCVCVPSSRPADFYTLGTVAQWQSCITSGEMIIAQVTSSHGSGTGTGPAPSATGVSAPAVPPLPSMVPKNPVEQAGLVLGAKQATAQQLINAALHVSMAEHRC